MDTRIALIGIVLSSNDFVDELNHLLSQYREYIIGRMGLPYREKGISIISVAIDAPGDVISALSGKLGMLPGVSTKTIYAKTPEMPAEKTLTETHKTAPKNAQEDTQENTSEKEGVTHL